MSSGLTSMQAETDRLRADLEAAREAGLADTEARTQLTADRSAQRRQARHKHRNCFCRYNQSFFQQSVVVSLSSLDVKWTGAWQCSRPSVMCRLICRWQSCSVRWRLRAQSWSTPLTSWRTTDPTTRFAVHTLLLSMWRVHSNESRVGKFWIPSLIGSAEEELLLASASSVPAQTRSTLHLPIHMTPYVGAGRGSGEPGRGAAAAAGDRDGAAGGGRPPQGIPGGRGAPVRGSGGRAGRRGAGHAGGAGSMGFRVYGMR